MNSSIDSSHSPAEDSLQFESRKRDHIDFALNPQNQSTEYAGLDRIRLAHDALPELDFDEITIHHHSLGKLERTPFFIAGMTAGHPQAYEINLRLALAAEKRGWTMGVGSQRRDLGKSMASELDRWQQIRKKAPNLTLYGNLGLSQIVGAQIQEVRALVDSLEASALAIHLNPLQEALQREGTPYFYGGIEAIAEIVAQIGVPVILKETGCGFSAQTVRKVRDLGIAAIDVSGLGGTHWGRIEGQRADSGTLLAQAAETFAGWGVSTVDSVIACREELVDQSTEIWASGGVRSGLDAAKLLALGADRIGYAQPALQAALVAIADGDTLEPLERWMERMEFELKVALLCTGSATPRELRGKEGKCES